MYQNIIYKIIIYVYKNIYGKDFIFLYLKTMMKTL